MVYCYALLYNKLSQNTIACLKVKTIFEYRRIILLAQDCVYAFNTIIFVVTKIDKHLLPICSIRISVF